jgi:hypothetical protein
MISHRTSSIQAKSLPPSLLQNPPPQLFDLPGEFEFNQAERISEEASSGSELFDDLHQVPGLVGREAPFHAERVKVARVMMHSGLPAIQGADAKSQGKL